MIEIVFSEEIKAKCPHLCVGHIEADVVNSADSSELWNDIREAEEQLRRRYTPDTLKLHPGIKATREAYRALGKDPSRYRPSNEALVRRVLKGAELYHVNTLVDLNNLASIHWGYSIGGFDRTKIRGPRLTLGVGREGEPYEGIGRGPLNIAHLPVYRDAEGGIGTPTSDNERTKMALTTTRLLFLVNGYDGNARQVTQCCEELMDLMRRYAGSDGGEFALEQPAACMPE
jgi:DNA/RNA-binding domain of Phe-tRNA-synthetase-like protein